MLDVGIGAYLRRRMRTFYPAFDVRRVSKGRAKHFLLVAAMRTPESAVHLGALRRQALSECVQAASLFVVNENIQASGRRYNQQADRSLR